MKRAETLLRLFWAFFKISLLVIGGGYAILAVAERVFARKLKWTHENELLDNLPLIQSVPGLIAGNTALYVGHKVAGRLGATCALLAVAIPSFIIFLLVAYYFDALPKESFWVDGAFQGSRAAIAGILASTTVRTFRRSVKGVYGYAAFAFAVTAVLGGWMTPAAVLLAGMACGLMSAAARGGTKVFASFAAIPLIFVKYGFLCFGGGFVLVPLYMRDFVGATAPYLRLSPEVFASVIALTQVTPGPVSINAATFFGFRLGGVVGAALATLALLFPSWLLFTCVLQALPRGRENHYVQGLLMGVKPVSTALLTVATLIFVGMACWVDGGVSYRGIVLSLVAYLLFTYTELPPALIILSSSALGLVAIAF